MKKKEEERGVRKGKEWAEGKGERVKKGRKKKKEKKRRERG